MVTKLLITIGIITFLYLAARILPLLLNSREWRAYDGESLATAMADEVMSVAASQLHVFRKLIFVDGDQTMPQTRAWNIWYVQSRWNKVVVFDVRTTGVHPGFLPRDGKARMLADPINVTRYRMRIGRESCQFFCVSPQGKLLPIRCVTVTTIDDPAYKDCPLF